MSVAPRRVRRGTVGHRTVGVHLCKGVVDQRGDLLISEVQHVLGERSLEQLMQLVPVWPR